MKIKNQSQRLLLFLIFSTLLKQIKIKSFGTKTLLKTCRKIKTLIFKSYNDWTGCLLADQTGRPRQKSVDWSGRLTCTDVHAAWAGEPVDRAVDSPESSALWKWPQSTGRELCSMYPVPVDRAVDWWHNDQKNDHWADWTEGQNCPFLLPTGRIFIGI